MPFGYDANVESDRFVDGDEVLVDVVAGRTVVDWPPTALPTSRGWFRRASSPAPLVTPERRNRFAFDAIAEVAVALLGRGFGTGPYDLYGEALLALRTLALVDDPTAPRPTYPPGELHG